MIKKIITPLIMAIIITLSLTGCIRPYDTPELIKIEPSQTAFLIPLVGDTTQQESFKSEDALRQSQVAMKEIQIPHRWVQTGRMNWKGEWRSTMLLVIVERKPVTREWTSGNDGTSTRNQGITAESKESTGFTAKMNITAQIDTEDDAARFLYRYNNMTLETILDTEIRAKVEQKFVEECAKRTMEEILLEKGQIMTAVTNEVIPYFAERGITITTLGLKGEFTYLNQDIQESIDKKFKSAQDLITQRNENERVLSKAKADAAAIEMQSDTIEKTLDSKRLDNQAQAIEKWDGKMPNVVGGGTTGVFDVGTLFSDGNS